MCEKVLKFLQLEINVWLIKYFDWFNARFSMKFYPIHPQSQHRPILGFQNMLFISLVRKSNGFLSVSCYYLVIHNILHILTLLFCVCVWICYYIYIILIFTSFYDLSLKQSATSSVLVFAISRTYIVQGNEKLWHLCMQRKTWFLCTYITYRPISFTVIVNFIERLYKKSKAIYFYLYKYTHELVVNIEMYV